MQADMQVVSFTSRPTAPELVTAWAPLARSAAVNRGLARPATTEASKELLSENTVALRDDTTENDTCL
jgi:hypothetical protein